jgi:Tfp pilus assembly protein PilX
MAIIAIVLVVLIVIAIIGYAVAGYAAGESRVSAADKSLNAVVSDQNKLTKTFKEIDTKFTGLSTGTNFDAAQAKTLLGQFIADSQDATKTVVRDQASLTASSTKLDELQWLTTIDKGNINKAHARLDHAQKALASAKIVSDDYVQDGQFLQSFMDVILDLDKLSASASASDLAGAKAVVATLKTHVDAATQQSTAPGLPTQMHALMVDFQTLTSDFGKLLDAAIAGDETGLTTYSDKLQTDVTKLGTYNFDQMGSDVTAFYKPYIDTFNSEMSAATA